MKALAILLCVLCVLLPRLAFGQDAGASDTIGGCVEIVPEGAVRPTLSSSFPSRGMSGYAATLTVKIVHGKGESVLPHGLRFSEGTNAPLVGDLRGRGFVIPEQDASAGASLHDAPAGDKIETTLELPLLLLPKGPGRQTLTLLSLPIAISRASGDFITLCTRSHTITVEDPIANTSDPKPHDNPPPQPQWEEWTALKDGLLYSAIGIVIGALLFWLWRTAAARPKPVPPPPPPRPAWEVALEALDEVRYAGLLDSERHDVFVDRINDILRKYLGDRYGFIGLEATSMEIIRSLRPKISITALHVVREFLETTDLIKFARVTPSRSDCEGALERGETIVRSTMPHATMTLTSMTEPAATAEPTAPADTAVTAETEKNPPPPEKPE